MNGETADNPNPSRQLTTISYGGGVQSTAMVVLACQGELGYDVDAALFSNVGDDSEHPDSIRYVREIAQPWAKERGLDVIELNPTRRGEETTLWKEIFREDSRRDLIPLYGEQGNPLSRSCTADFKVKTLERWHRAHGATRDNPNTVLLGISVDEIERAGRKSNDTITQRRYPLLDLGLHRHDCEQIIRDAGLPVPRKSSCFFCPFHSRLVWSEMRRDEPELFEKAQQLEDHVLNRKAEAEMRAAYITRQGAISRKRLSDVIHEAGPTLFGGIGETGCDSGYCFT